jgi:hypothetical protein
MIEPGMDDIYAYMSISLGGHRKPNDPPDGI